MKRSVILAAGLLSAASTLALGSAQAGVAALVNSNVRQPPSARDSIAANSNAKIAGAAYVASPVTRPPLASPSVAAKPVALASSANVVAANTTRLAQTQVVAVGQCCPPVQPCCPQPAIQYVHRGGCACGCGCNSPPPVETVLMATPPCGGCPVPVTVCLPGCTTGGPKVCYDRGLLGRPVQWFEWPNGFAVKVVFKYSGDLIVTTFGS
jgi:hypothetical protein